jgi:signal transduction histidine kinase
VPDDFPVAPEQGRLAVPSTAAAERGSDTPPVSGDTPPVGGDTPPVGGDTPPVGGGDAWNTGMPRWDRLYAIAFAAVFVVLLASTGSADHRATALSAIAAMAPWYLLVGRPHITSAGGSVTPRSVIYVTGIVALFGVAVLAAPNAFFLCVALLPQCYQVLPARWALIPALAMTTLGGASVAYWDRGSRGLETAIGLFVAISAFTVAFGGYIGRIITQSVERASLIAQLEATRAELAQVSRQAGVLAERQRLAGEIHDTLAQGFSSILMLIQAAQAQLAPEAAIAHGQLELAAQTARENLAEARTLVTGLTSAQLQAGTLEDALRRITQRAGAEIGIDASFAVEGAGRQLPAATDVVLLRTGQEALANVRKHAAARSVAVRLRYAAGTIRLEVTDDGTGFDPAAVNGGYGLAGMRARVDEVGGAVEVRSAPAEGTSVLVEVPG